MQAEPEYKDSFRSWLVFLPATFFFFYLVLQLAVFNSISTGLMHDFNMNATTLSKLSATYLYSCSVFFLPAGLLLDRFSTKNLLIIACLVCVIGVVLIASTSVLWVAFLG